MVPLLRRAIASGACVAGAMLGACAAPSPDSARKHGLRAEDDGEALFSDADLAETAGNREGKAVSVSQPTKAAAAPKPTWSVPGAPSTSPAPRTAKPLESDEVDRTAAPAKGAADDRRWSVLLLSFTAEGHEQLARAACEQLRGRYRELGDAFVRTKEKGSVVLVGRFSSPKDPDAKPMLKSVQSIVDSTGRPFARALLTRWEPSRDTRPGPHDLRQARRANPSVARLFSLEVAVWSDFGSGEIAIDDIRKKAEAYARQLRAQGAEAFYFHDDDRKMSIVTVGVFGEDAYNPQTMLFSDAVDAVKRKFPSLLVNGETLLKLKHPGSKETVPEPSVLVEVPK